MTLVVTFLTGPLLHRMYQIEGAHDICQLQNVDLNLVVVSPGSGGWVMALVMYSMYQEFQFQNGCHKKKWNGGYKMRRNTHGDMLPL